MVDARPRELGIARFDGAPEEEGGVHKRVHHSSAAPVVIPRALAAADNELAFLRVCVAEVIFERVERNLLCLFVAEHLVSRNAGRNVNKSDVVVAHVDFLVNALSVKRYLPLDHFLEELVSRQKIREDIATGVHTRLPVVVGVERVLIFRRAGAREAVHAVSLCKRFELVARRLRRCLELFSRNYVRRRKALGTLKLNSCLYHNMVPAFPFIVLIIYYTREKVKAFFDFLRNFRAFGYI